MIHNESVNIWSHFAGASCFVLFGVIIAFALMCGTFNAIPQALVGKINMFAIEN